MILMPITEPQNLQILGTTGNLTEWPAEKIRSSKIHPDNKIKVSSQIWQGNNGSL